MTDKHDLNEFENHLRSFRPRLPKLDLASLRSQVETQPTSVIRRPVMALLGSWSFGAVVGAAAMFLMFRFYPENSTNSTEGPTVNLKVAGDAPNTSDKSLSPNSLEGESIVSKFDLLLVGMYEPIPLEAGFSVRKRHPSGTRPPLDRPVSDDPSKSNSNSQIPLYEEATSPPTRDRLMRDFLNANSGVY